MNDLIKEKIFSIQNENQIAIVGFLPLGFPNPEAFQELVQISLEEGVDLIEFGVPTENSYLDGNIISQAYNHLKKVGNFNLEDLVKQGGEILNSSAGIGFPIVYKETMEKISPITFFKMLQDANYHGVIIPNVRNEQRKNFSRLSSDHGLAFIGFVGTNYSQEEIEEVVDQSNGFLYMQGISGSTGQHIQIDQSLISRYENLKEYAEKKQLPVLIGFGVRDADDVKKIRDINADGVIIGTSFVKAASKTKIEFRDYLREIKDSAAKRRNL